MDSNVTLHFHHGGEFAFTNGVKYYKGGKVEHVYDQRLDVLSMPMFDDYVQTELEYDDFKLYWHKSGCLFNEVNCKFMQFQA